MSSIDEFLLASYPLPVITPGTSTLATPAPRVAAVSYPQSKSKHSDSQRLLVQTPHGGLAVYDLADQTPLSSITLGPSFSPTTSAVSRSTPLASADSIRVKGSRKTWVGVHGAEEGKGEVWEWTEDERKDGSTDGEPSKMVYPISSTLSALLAPRSLPNHLLLLASSGSLALATSDALSVVASLSTSSGTPTSQALHVFPLTAQSSVATVLPSSIRNLLPTQRKGPHLLFVTRCFGASTASSAAGASLAEIGKKKFKRTKRPSSAAVIEEAEARGTDVLDAQDESSMHTEIEIVLLDPEVEVEGDVEAQPRFASLGSVTVSADEAADHVVVSEEGIVSTFSSRQGALKSWRIQFGASGVEPTASSWSELFSDTAEGTFAPTLAPVKTFALSPRALSPSSASHTQLIALHSSFVLLASLKPTVASSPSTEDAPPAVTCLLWDVRLGAVIASTTLVVSTAVTTSRAALGFSLSLPTPTTATIALFPTGVGATGRVAIFGLPLSPPLPSASVLAAVVGKQALTAQFLAGPSASSSSNQPPQLREPIRHPRTSARKQALLDASERARTAVLQRLHAALPATGSRDIEAAEAAFSSFMAEEKGRLVEYNVAKVRAAVEKEKERRVAALKERDAVKHSTKKFEIAKRRIEELIAEAEGKAVSAGEEFSWKEVTSKRIKGVSDIYRYKYYDDRVVLEEQLGQVTRDDSLEKALKAVEKQEPAVPSAFVTAVLRLCFPTAAAEASSSDVVLASSSSGKPASVPPHPVSIVSVLLERGLVGDGQIEGGVTRQLARAGDWTNVLKALDTMPDIAEATTVALLRQVVQDNTSTDAATVSTSLPQPAPSLATFLPSFLASPSTPSTLRTELATQLSAAEALPVLQVLDDFLSWWARHGGGGGDLKSAGAAGNKKHKRLAVDPFVVDLSHEEQTPPRVELILPVVEALLDAHFVSLLLQRQSHATLRRLSRHVAAHVALSSDLSTLQGALAIYARAKEDMVAEKRAAHADEERGSTARRTDVGARKLGKSMEARVKAQEKHNEVGAYSVDQFYL